MATRHQAREAIIGLLYAYDLGNPEIKKFAEDILEEKKIRNRQREFALSLFKGVVEHLEEIDKEIKKHLESWDLDRVGHIERAILRLGAYELMFTDLDKAIAINEAIELSKKLGTDQSPKFVNGVLDAIAKEREEKQKVDS
ncbi:transcription antitermination factor NusB [Nitrosophilus alvini]|uniref:transcription antitermination factor NusB n=1 Tax=Nitrosophilus alvini TaxID=2714855 RepID=UPI00190ADB01|nr:transcription antitermination factor NusB [Nitrosophilus alvini]